MTPTEVAEQQGRVLIAQFVRDQMTDTEIAQTLRMTRWRIAPIIAEVREELQVMGIETPPRRGSWGWPARVGGSK